MLRALLIPGLLLPLSGMRAEDPDDAPPPPDQLLRQGKLGSNETVGSILFSPDGKTLAVCGDDGVLLQDTDTGRERALIPGHKGKSTVLAFSRDGKQVATVDEKDVIHTWDVATGHERLAIETYSEEDGVSSLAFSPDGKTLLSTGGDGSIRLWEAETGKPVLRIEREDAGEKPACVAFSPDAHVLATLSNEDSAIRLLDVATGKGLAILKGHDEPVRALAFSRDGKVLLSAGEDGSIRLWDPETGGQFLKLKTADNGNGTNAAALSPDDKLIASGHDDHTLRLWETASGKELLRLPGHASEIDAVAFSPDGKRLVSGDSDGRFLVWDMDRILSGGRPSDPERLWKDLAGPAPLQTLRDLAAMPEQAVPFIQDRLKPVTGVPEQAAGLIVKLDDDDFAVREAATKSLEEMGAAVEPALRKALEGSPSAEVRERLEKLVASLDSPVLSSPEDLRCSRAVFLLERIGSPPARDLLTKLASGLEGARLTRDAKGALERLGPMPAVKPAEAPARP